MRRFFGGIKLRGRNNYAKGSSRRAMASQRRIMNWGVKRKNRI